MKILEDYKKSLKMLEVEEVLDLIIYRPLAFLFVKIIVGTNLTPNQVTTTALIFGVIGSFLFYFNTPEAYFTAGVLFIIYDVLDCADGQLARIKKNGTPIGRVLDGLADYIVSTLAYLFIGIGFAGNSDSPILYWGLTIAAGLSNAVHSSVLDFYRNRFLDYALDRESILGDSLKEFKDMQNDLKGTKGNFYEKSILWVYLKYSQVQLKFSSSSVETERKKYDAKDFYKKHKTIMHFWTYIGPTSELTFLIIASMVNRLDIYLLGIITAGNLYTAILYFFQNRINKSTKLSG
jgi:phosphatidylglycerophosphate synthase